MKFCKTCGSQLPDEAVFCTNCGAVMEEVTSNTTVLGEEAENTDSNGATTVLSFDESDEKADEQPEKQEEPVTETEVESNSVSFENKIVSKSNNNFDKKAVIKIVKIASICVLAVAVIVFAILLCVRFNNLNIKNVAGGSADLGTIVFEADGEKCEFSLDDTLGTIESESSITIEDITVYDKEQNNVSVQLDDTLDFDFDGHAFLQTENRCVDINFYGDAGESPADCHIGSFHIFKNNSKAGIEPDFINGIYITSASAKDVVAAWGEPYKVGKSDSFGFNKRLYYVTGDYKYIVYLDLLGRVESIRVE